MKWGRVGIGVLAGLLLAASTARSAVVDSVQTGTATSNANGTLTVPITSIDPTRAFLMFQTRHASNRPVGSMLRGRIASPTTLEFVRVTDEATPTPIEIRWYVAHFSSGVRVQRGQATQDNKMVNVTLPSPVGALSQAFVLWSKTGEDDDDDWEEKHPILGELTSTTNLQFRSEKMEKKHTIWWQVVEFTDPGDILVQKGDTRLKKSDLSVDVTLPTAVDVSRTFVLVGYASKGKDEEVGRRLLRAQLLDPTTIRIDRAVSGDDVKDIVWQAVELRDGSRVQHGSANLAGGIGQVTVPISTVDPARSLAFASTQPLSGQNIGRTPYETDDIIGVGSATLALAASQLDIERMSVVDEADFGWFVVEFAPLAAEAEWRLEEGAWSGSPAEVVDETGHGHDGTALGALNVGATPALTGDPGTCLYGGFDGTDDSIQVPHDAALNGRTKLSYTAWIYPRTWSGSIRQVLAKSVHGGGSGRAQMGIFSEGGFLKGRIETPAGRFEAQGALPPLNTWSHVAASFDLDELTLYVNGVVVGTQTFARTSLLQNNDPLEIGKRVGSAQYFFDGLIDEVRVYDERLTGAQVAALMNERHPCSASVAKFVVGHDGAGIHCLGEPVSVTAADSLGNPVPSYAGTIVLNTQSGTGTWTLAVGAGSFSDPVADDGLATYTFAAADAGRAEFLLEYRQGASPIDIRVDDGVASDDDTEGPLAFAPSGFTVTSTPLPNPPPDPIVDPIPSQTAGTDFLVHLSAFGTTPTDPACGVIETYGGAKAITFWSSYSDPVTGTRQIAIDGGTIATSEAAAAPQAVTFTSGQAVVVAKYKDVGRMLVSLKDDTVSEPVGGLRGATNPFVVHPADLFITGISRPDATPNPGTSVPTGPIFVASGTPFQATVEVRDAEGDLTPNFGNESIPEGIQLTSSTLVAPAGGRNGTLNDGAIGNATAFGPVLPAGTFRGNTFYWDEIGAIRLEASIADADYLGSGDVTGTESSTVGRFQPFDFGVAMNAPSFVTACAGGGFTYLGQPFAYGAGQEPVLTFTARNAQGGTTANYTGGWFRLQADDLTGLSYAAATGALVPAIPADPTVNDLGTGQGTLVFENDANLRFQRTTPMPPFDADIALTLNVIDEDGVSYAANPAQFGAPLPGGGMSFSAGSEQRFGRLVMENGHDSEQLPVPVPFTAQYYDGAVFLLHAADSCTPLATAFLQQTPVPGALPTTPAVNPLLVAGDGGLVMSAPLAPGYVDLLYDLGAAAADLAWLMYDWDGDSLYDDSPFGRATFGIFKGSDRVIYRREVY